MTANDVTVTLHDMSMLITNEDGEFVICASSRVVEQVMDKWRRKKYPQADSKLLQWQPFILLRRGVHYSSQDA